MTELARRVVRISRARLAPASDRYDRLFHISEIASSTLLQWFFGASLLIFFETFSRWILSASITIETAERKAAVCWPYFTNCYEYYFLRALPDGYSQTALYMFFFSLMLGIVWSMYRSRWRIAHALLSVLLLWKVIVVFLLSYTISGPYDYYHIILTVLLLFAGHKEYFLRLAFVFLYFMAATTKFDPTWTLGAYFTTLKTGLPLFPDILTPLFTNLVIFSQIVGGWFLLSKRKWLQRTALVFFLAFHLYSGLLVAYPYPAVSVPFLLILFGPFYRPMRAPFDRYAAAGWTLIALVALFQLLGFVTLGDRRLSLEGNRFGMYMFEANHQCVVTVRTYSQPSKSAVASVRETPLSECEGFYCLVSSRTTPTKTALIREDRYESSTAWNRCDPYEWWARLHLQCGRGTTERVSLRLDHSINGSPFYRIVDEPNVCDLEYAVFRRNSWIKLPPEAPVVGYPVRNEYAY